MMSTRTDERRAERRLPGARRVAAACVSVAAIVAAGLVILPAGAGDTEAERLEAQVERLDGALVDARLEKDDLAHRAWDPFYQELWGNTPEARQETQTNFDSSDGGNKLREGISAAAARAEETRSAAEKAESAGGRTPTEEQRLEVLRARVIHLQARLDAENAVIAYHKALGVFVKEAVTGWADEWIKEPFFEFSRTYAGPFLEKMVSEVVSEAQSRVVDMAVNQDPSKWNPGIGAGEAAKGYSKVIRMAIKSGMDVEMRVLFQKRLNELAAANGYDPIPGQVSSYLFDTFILAKAQEQLEADEDGRAKWLDKGLKAVLKRILKDNAAHWGTGEAAQQAQRQYLEEFSAEWKRALGEAQQDLTRRGLKPEDREKILVGVRERVRRYMESRKDVYAKDVMARLTDAITKRFDEFARDPKKLSDGLSILENADFAVNDVAVPLITVWMNGAQFEAIVENEIFKYHIVDEFVKRKTNSRMTLSLFKEWHPRYDEIAKYRDRWDLTVRVDSLEVPADPRIPFRVTLHYSVRGISALSEMKMAWTCDGPDAAHTDWEARTTFADEYDLEKAKAQPARWDWLLTSREVPAPGLYTVRCVVKPNYAPIGENPIAGPKLLGWTAERRFVYGRADAAAADSVATAADTAGVAGADTLDAAAADSADAAAADSTAAPDSTAAAEIDSTAAPADSAGVAAADSASTDNDLEALLDELDDALAADADLLALIEEFDQIDAELRAAASRFDTADRFFMQRMNEGGDAACGEFGLAFARSQAQRILEGYLDGLTALEGVAAVLLAATDEGADGVDAADIEFRCADAAAVAHAMEARLLGDMQAALDTFGCDENEMEREGETVSDPQADPDDVDLGGYAGGGTEVCGDGEDNDGDDLIDECDAGCCEGRNVQITVSDCGDAADDVFLIAVDGRSVGITPKGASHTVSVELSDGDHNVTVTTLDDGGEPGVADNIGTFAATVVVDGVETIGGAGCSNLALGASADFGFTVGGPAKAERSIPAAALRPVGRAAGAERP